VEFVLIRHAQPEWVKDGRNVVNPPLTELGFTQAERLAKALDGESFDELYVSPLTRARQTGAPVLGLLGVPEVIEPWLEEIRDPDWHGQPSEGAMKAFRALRQRVAVEQWDGLPGGEPMHEFVARVRVGASEFLERRGIRRIDDDLPVWSIDDPERRIGLIAHAGTNSVFTCLLLGLDPTPWEWDRLVMRHTSISRLIALPIGDGFVFSLSSLSDVEHLDHDQRTV
jgi:probable phosphoglycerate mutase